jgi:hypothetical protein
MYQLGGRTVFLNKDIPFCLIFSQGLKYKAPGRIIFCTAYPWRGLLFILLPPPQYLESQVQALLPVPFFCVPLFSFHSIRNHFLHKAD